MTSQATIPARREREALCDLFLDVGPDAPTLSGEWTTRDLAAHLVMRERRPDGAAGIVVKKLAGHADKVQSSIAEKPWDELVSTVRDGPPIWSPTRVGAVDRLANTIEFYVHHEDVRRARESWAARELDQDLRDDLRGALSKMVKALARSSKVGIVLEPTDTTDTNTVVAKQGDPSVTIRGPIGELVLYMYGRKEQAEVELEGDAEAVEAVTAAEFGV